jgi:hypothetical protein
MTRVNVVCEGKTEVEFVKIILVPHFSAIGVLITPHDLHTGTKYPKLRDKVLDWLKAEPRSYVTTLIDLYAMPNDFPGQDAAKGRRGKAKIDVLEAAFAADVAAKMGAKFDKRRFIPHYQLHEFEALLFSNPKIMEDRLGLDRTLKPGCFQVIRDAFPTPEDINEVRDQSPAKRIEAVVIGQQKYSKPVEGIAVVSEIGLHQMRQACPHFNSWITQLEQLAPNHT